MKTGRGSGGIREAARPAAPVVAAVDMGYGHLRAAWALAAAAGTAVVEADRAPAAGLLERAVWGGTRGAYGILSRAAGAGRPRCARRMLDGATFIGPLRRGAPPTPPGGESRFLSMLGRAGFGRRLAGRLRESGETLLATFYAQAILADAAGCGDVWCVVTDADIHRVWVPRDPASSGVRYCAPCRNTARRLRAYGVPGDRIRVTGFPLPPALLGGADLGVLRANLAARLARLDPEGAFRARRGAAVEEALGPLPPPGGDGPPRVAFCVGGSGAQASLGRGILAAFRDPLVRGEVRLTLVAGVHGGVADAFLRWSREEGLEPRAGGGLEILVADGFDAYERAFNGLLASTDLLWTKPSELVFFAGLGLPLLLAPSLGFHERRNRRLAMRGGFAVDARDPAEVPARIAAGLRDGSLAEAAWSGFRGLPSRGTWRILEVAGIAPSPLFTGN